MTEISYAGCRFPSQIIHQSIWPDLRFTLSSRDVEDPLAERAYPDWTLGMANPVAQQRLADEQHTLNGARLCRRL